MSDPSLQAIEATVKHMDTFAREGLRTLVLAQAELLPEDFEEWADRYEEVRVLNNIVFFSRFAQMTCSYDYYIRFSVVFYYYFCQPLDMFIWPRAGSATFGGSVGCKYDDIYIYYYY